VDEDGRGWKGEEKKRRWSGASGQPPELSR
jgi:hypothetical protein